MKFKTWEAIAKRHVWYRALLVERMRQSEASIDQCRDMKVLASVVKLAERAERHEQRMERHLRRGLANLEEPSGARH